MSRLPPVALRAALSEALGAAPDWSGARTVGGGSISFALSVPCGSQRLFVKWLDDAPPDFFEAEARGLSRLGEALPVPAVLALARAGRAAAIALSFHSEAPPTAAMANAAGEALAALHRIRGSAFGGVPDNFIGRVPQSNVAASSGGFAAFFRERRLDPHLHLLPPELRHRIAALPLDRLLDDASPTLVHGDLWSGNLIFTAAGPLFVDPAAHFGHPLTDLAMMRIFGGIPAAVERTFLEVAGIPSHDLDDRVAVLQLYPLLIHLRLFGSAWIRDISRTLSQLERP